MAVKNPVPHVEDIHVASEAGARMQRLAGVTAMKGLGLVGDRYCTRAGFWRDSRDGHQGAAI